MRTRRSNYPNNSNVTIPRRRRKQVSNIVEPEIRTIVMAERTMEELLRAPTEGYGEAIVLPEINADHFEIKTNLLQLVQANSFNGRENENPHAHINSFKRITSTLRFRNVPNDVIKLMMFPYSLEGAAKTCEAWERFKELLRACPHHGFTKFTQVDTFYNGLNENEQDSLNAAAGGNILSKTTREALNIIENKSKVRYLRNRSKWLREDATSSKINERIDKLADQLSTLVEIVSKKFVTPAPVKAVEETYVTSGGAHSCWNEEPMDDIVSSDEEWEESDYGNPPITNTNSSSIKRCKSSTFAAKRTENIFPYMSYSDRQIDDVVDRMHRIKARREIQENVVVPVESETDSDIQYAVSIKEDTAYYVQALHRYMKEQSSTNAVSQETSIRVFRYRNKIFWKVVHDKEFNKELLTPFKDLEREFRSSRINSKEEVAEAMVETMEQSMRKTRADYGSGVARPKIDDKDHFELKSQFLKELQDNTFNGSDHEDSNEHIEKVLEIVDLFHVPNITQD
ncbi:reverse transcriptase domain-containing protein [Tanacetum coccineum]